MSNISGIGFRDIIDIVGVSVMIYYALRFIRGTRGLYMLTGLMICILIFWLSRIAELKTLHWIFEKIIASLFLVIIVIFQHDIRRLLTRVGRSTFFVPQLLQEQTTLEELVKTSVSLANKKIGGILAIEREGSVADHIEQGTPIDAQVSKDLLTSIFLPVSPLHDGAVLIQGARVSMAGCLLPLTMNPRLSKVYGTRHLAAIGLSEEVDAVVVVISEETGLISLAIGGEIEANLDGQRLRERLQEIFNPPTPYSIFEGLIKRLFNIRRDDSTTYKANH